MTRSGHGALQLEPTNASLKLVDTQGPFRFAGSTRKRRSNLKRGRRCLLATKKGSGLAFH
jgi:hypothetical protein